jgi:hypothetical protein
MVHRFVALAAVMLLATLLLCLLHAGDDGDLCSASAVPSVGLATASTVALTERLLPEADDIYHLCLSNRPAPPPKT